MSKHSPDPTPERGLPLSGKVSRVIQNVADIAYANDLADSSPEDLGAAVSIALHASRARAQYLPGELFSDAAWLMLLELLHGEIEERAVSMSRLCKASGTAPGTANRWLNALDDKGLVTRRGDARDAPNAFVELTPAASTALRLYFSDVAQLR